MKPYSRRSFVKKAVQASAILALNPFKFVFAASQADSALPTWTSLVEIARWCPSVHNLQPHQLKIISETEADLYYDPTRLLPVGDPNAVFVTVALAIFVEHLSIAAGTSGAQVEISQVYQNISMDAKGSTLFARLKMSPSIEKEYIDQSWILKRRTSRLHYDGKKLLPSTLEKVRKETTKFGHEFFESSDQELIDFIIDLNQQTLFEDLESKSGREELHGLFRYTDEEAKEHKDGLWAKCMDFPGKLMKSVFTHHERWEKGPRKKLLGNYYQSSFKGTATLCWFGGEFGNTQDWLNAGKMLARNWLIMTGDGAYIHPFGSLITNAGAYQKINEKLPKVSGNKKIWLIFRAGYSKEPVRSYRLSTEEIILK